MRQTPALDFLLAFVLSAKPSKIRIPFCLFQLIQNELGIPISELPPGHIYRFCDVPVAFR